MVFGSCIIGAQLYNLFFQH